jgi:hypothetical protein
LLQSEYDSGEHILAIALGVAPYGAVGVSVWETGRAVLTFVCPDGTQAWRAEVPVAPYQALLRVTFGPDGDLWLSGADFPVDTLQRFVARYSNEGELKFARIYPGHTPEDSMGGSHGDNSYGLTFAGERGPFVTGTKRRPNGHELWLAELDGAGNILWEYTDGEPENRGFAHLVEASDSQLVMLAEQRPPGTEGQGPYTFLRGFSLSGEPSWQVRVDQNQMGSAGYLAYRDGQILLGGAAMHADALRPRLQAYRDDGEFSWDLFLVDEYGTNVEVALDSEGRRYTMGRYGTDEENWPDALRIYDAEGALLEHLETPYGAIVMGPQDHLYTLTSRSPVAGWLLTERVF